MGLLWAVEFADEITPKVIENANKLGLLMNPTRPNLIRLMPPLTVSINELDEALNRLESAIQMATK